MGSTARLVRRATRRPRGARGRRAWRRLVRMCARGDAAAQDAVRSADLPEADVLDLLAVAPERPADRAAFLTLIGQHAQRQALDPDGSLLALAYRAAAHDMRERLRAILATGGDAEVVRVVITGDQRDRVAEMTHEELGYLGHQLAEHRRWDELRRLALDLPPATAAALIRLLPERERTDETAMLDEWSPERIQAIIARLPREKVTSHRNGNAQVSFAPDQTELAVNMSRSDAAIPTMLVETVRIGTGESTVHLREPGRGRKPERLQILHLGEEIIRTHGIGTSDPTVITWVHPRHERISVEGPEIISTLRRASTGAVAITRSGLVFFDHGAAHQRHLSVPSIAARVEEGIKAIESEDYHCNIATLPSDRLVAAVFLDRLLILDESGTVLHDFRGDAHNGTFLTPNSFAVNPILRNREILTFAPSGEVRREVVKGTGPEVFAELRGFPLDFAFATGVAGRLNDSHELVVAAGGPEWLQGQDTNRLRYLIKASPYGDMIVTSTPDPPVPRRRYDARRGGRLEVHGPHLFAAREAVERPLLHATPQDLSQVRALRSRIGDPEVRALLGTLVTCLANRFEHEIALGTGPAPAGGPTDIAVGDG